MSAGVAFRQVRALGACAVSAWPLLNAPRVSLTTAPRSAYMFFDIGEVVPFTALGGIDVACEVFDSQIGASTGESFYSKATGQQGGSND